MLGVRAAVQSPGVMEYESASLAYPLLPPMEPSAPPYVPYPPPANSDSYAAPAPSAPPGDGWLVAGESKGDEPSTDVKHAPGSVPEVIEHIVMQSDTLQGICLRYNVTLRELKRWNQFPRVRVTAPFTPGFCLCQSHPLGFLCAGEL